MINDLLEDHIDILKGTNFDTDEDFDDLEDEVLLDIDTHDHEIETLTNLLRETGGIYDLPPMEHIRIHSTGEIILTYDSNFVEDEDALGDIAVNISSDLEQVLGMLDGNNYGSSLDLTPFAYTGEAPESIQNVYSNESPTEATITARPEQLTIEVRGENVGKYSTLAFLEAYARHLESNL